MKQTVVVYDVNARFYNSGDGFSLALDHKTDGHSIYLHLDPWDKLAAFTSAVVDYSWSNGLGEVPIDELEALETSLATALGKVKSELAHRDTKIVL